MRSTRCLFITIVLLLCLGTKTASAQNLGIDTGPATDTAKVVSNEGSELAVDEGLKCTRQQLVDRKFITTGKSKYGEILRVTYQDLERGGREIIFQKKLMENDNVEFFMPSDLLKDAKTAVLIVMKGDGMFYKKIDITD
jgi:hypothetical protein